MVLLLERAYEGYIKGTSYPKISMVYVLPVFRVPQP